MFFVSNKRAQQEMKYKRKKKLDWNETIATRAHRMYVEYFLINSVLNVQERTKCAQGENRCENDASSFFYYIPLYNLMRVLGSLGWCGFWMCMCVCSVFRLGGRMPNTLKLSLYTGFNHTEADGFLMPCYQKRRLIYTDTFTHTRSLTGTIYVYLYLYAAHSVHKSIDC